MPWTRNDEAVVPQQDISAKNMLPWEAQLEVYRKQGCLSNIAVPDTDSSYATR